MPADEKINFGARFEYLKVIQEQGPDVLSDLQLPFAVYRTYFESNPNSLALHTLAGLVTTLRNEPSRSLNDLDQALRKWSLTHGLQDDWILDAAIQTMHSWARGGPLGKWGYVPKELNAPKFESRFGHWVPQYLKWAEFKKISDGLYRRELASYRAKIRNMWGEGQSSLSEHAVWTVLWQQGKSPEAIQRLHFKKTGQTLSSVAIQKAVHELAASAGVTLRRPKAGRGARKM
jgi:hypothetical protein